MKCLHDTDDETGELEELVAVGVALDEAGKDGETAETDSHNVAKVRVVPVAPVGLDDVHPGHVVRVDEVSGEVVQEVDGDAAELMLSDDCLRRCRLTKVRFMTRLGMIGWAAKRNSQIMKAMKRIPPTLYMAIREAGYVSHEVRDGLLTVLVSALGTSAERSRREEACKRETEEEETKRVDLRPVVEDGLLDGTARRFKTLKDFTACVRRRGEGQG